MTWHATGCTSAAQDITRAACLGWLRPLQNLVAQIVQNLMRATLNQVKLFYVSSMPSQSQAEAHDDLTAVNTSGSQVILDI